MGWAKTRMIWLSVCALGALAAAGNVQASTASPDVSVEEDAHVCGGAGFTSARLESSGDVFCTHSHPDGHAQHRGATTSSGSGVAAHAAHAAQPACYGDGISGKRVQAIYAVPAGQAPDALVLTRISDVWIPNMEGTVRSHSRDFGRELGIRFVTDGACKPVIAVLELPADTATVDQTQFARINSAVQAHGYNWSDRKYLIWFHGSGAACGIATLARDDSPGPLNAHNGTTPLRTNRVMANFAQVYSPCWGLGSSGADVELHELFHNLGAVQWTAPNSNGLGHCKDEADILCYSEGGQWTHTACPWPVQRLDCNGDDYFNSNPLPGTYLATHWNTANSRFLDAFPTDLLPGDLPFLLSP